MTRTFWFALGAASGVYGVLKARRAARAVSPDGLAARLAALRAGAAVLTRELAAGMADGEQQVRDRLGSASALDGESAIPAMLEAGGPDRLDGAAGETAHREEPSPVGHR